MDSACSFSHLCDLGLIPTICSCLVIILHQTHVFPGLNLPNTAGIIWVILLHPVEQQKMILTETLKEQFKIDRAIQYN
jgi:hypothetical protein